MMAFIGISPGPAEFLFIFVVLLLLFGAKNLPGLARQFGSMMETFRRATRDVTDEFMWAETRESEDDAPERLPPHEDGDAAEQPRDETEGDHERVARDSESGR